METLSSPVEATLKKLRPMFDALTALDDAAAVWRGETRKKWSRSAFPFDELANSAQHSAQKAAMCLLMSMLQFVTKGMESVDQCTREAYNEVTFYVIYAELYGGIL